MADETQITEDAKILPADTSLSKKLGGVSLTKILTPDAMKNAEKVIEDSSDDFYGDCVRDEARLLELAAQIKKDGGGAGLVQEIIAVAFTAKTKAGLSGYDLVVSLAASLQVFCEKLTGNEPGATAIQIIDWHAQSMNQLLSKKIKGAGGEVGKAILTEIEKINSP